MSHTFPARFSIRDRRILATLAAVGWVAYFLALVFAYPVVKEPIVALTIVPLAVSGFAVGPRWGLLIGLANIAVHILFFRLAGRLDLLLPSESAVRVATGLVIPIATGWFGDLFIQLGERSEELARQRTALRAEISERHKVQQALRQTLEEIEVRVQERTAALRESEERYRVISEIMSDFAFSIRVDPDGKFTTEWMTGAFNRITGYNTGQVADWLILVHPADREATRSLFQPIDSTKPGLDEFRIITKGGETRWIHAHVRRKQEPTQGKIVHVYAAIQDITDRKRVEEALNESQTRYRIVSELTADFAYAMRCDSDGSIAPEWFGEALSRVTGFSMEELHARGGLPGITYPADLPIAIKHIQTVLSGQQDTCEFRIVTKNGDIRWNRNFARPVWDEPGQRVTRIYGAGQDITERKQAEDALRAVNEYNASIIDSSLDMIIAVDQDRKITEFNKAALETFGYSLEEVLGQDAVMLYATAPEVHQVSQALLSGERVRQEVWNRRKNGDVFPSLLSASALRNTRGELIGSMGVSRDITERKRAEESLRASEAKNLAIVQAIPDMVVRMSRDGVILDFKPGAGMQVPMPPGALVGKSVHELNASGIGMPAGAIGQFLEFMYRSLQTGESQTFESAVQFAGVPRHYETRLVASGENEALGIVRDITARKEADAERERLFEELRAGRERLVALSQRLVETQELERREIARELHDQVGQSLTGLSINLNIIRTQLSAESMRQVAGRVQDSLNLVDTTVERVRDVMADLRPAVLDDYGLEAGLRWLCNRFTERMGVSTHVHGAEVTPRLPIERETALFRVAQEALNNIAKYAKAKQVTLTLETIDQQIRLTIADDGIGFDEAARRQPGTRQSWGLSLMRERARGVGGDMYIHSAPGKGTAIVAEVPR